MYALPGLVLLAGALVPAATATPPAGAAPRAAVEQPARPAPRPSVPPPRPWGVESPRSAGARFGLGVDLRLDRLEGLEAIGGSTAVVGPGGTVVPVDPGLDNRKLERELELDGVGLQAPVALPRFALGGLAVDPSLVLEVAAVDARLDFRPRTPNDAGASLDGRGTQWGVGVEWVATACRRCRVFWGGGYRFRTLSGLDLDRRPRLDGAFEVLADEVRLGSDTHLVTGRVGFAARGGRFAPYLGARGRWSEVEVEDELRFRGPTGAETALRTRLELEDDGVAGVVGLDARLGGRLLGRVEAAVGDQGTAALVKLVHHFGGGRRSAGSGEVSEELERRAPGLAADLERIRRQLDEGRRALDDVSGPGAAPAYRLVDVLALLDRTEAALADALADPILGPLRDLFTVAIAEARAELMAATRTAQAAPVRRRPGIALAAWQLAQDRPAGDEKRLGSAVDSVLERLSSLIDWARGKAAAGELEVDLCICGQAPGVARQPTFRATIYRYYWDEPVVDEEDLEWAVSLTLGIYRIGVEVYDERGSIARRRRFERIEDQLDLRQEGSTLRCITYPTAPATPSPDPPWPDPRCDLTDKDVCGGCG
jgi:hypothetical protein